MDQDFWLNWIISDYTPFICKGKSLFISTPSRESRFIAEDIYLNCYRKAIEDGALSEDDINQLLKKYKLWNVEDENRLDAFTREVDDLKVHMFQNWANDVKLLELKKLLDKTNESIEEMLGRRGTFDSISAKSVANYSRQHFLLGCSIFREKKRPFWKNPLVVWERPDEVLSSAYITLSRFVLLEGDYRELARSASWRGIWATKRGVGGLFGRPVVDLSLHQRNLISWSNLYDNVYKHPDCPDDFVVETDDLLDGWMIFQKRKRESEQAKNSISRSVTNKKILNSEEVFIMMDSVPVKGSAIDKFNAIYNMNDIGGKIALKRRMDQIQREGRVEESNMIDRRLLIKQQCAAMGG